MSIRQSDLDKMNDLTDLAEQWRQAAAALGITLKSVLVEPDNSFTSNTVWYNDGTGDAPFWQID